MAVIFICSRPLYRRGQLAGRERLSVGTAILRQPEQYLMFVPLNTCNISVVVPESNRVRPCDACSVCPTRQYEQDMHNIRFILRDTQPASEAREDMSKLHRRIARKKARGLKSPVDAYPGEFLKECVLFSFPCLVTRYSRSFSMSMLAMLRLLIECVWWC